MRKLLQSYILLLCIFLLFRTLYIAFSRLYLHPLKTFPGPRLAALTDYYQVFYKVWRNGMFTKHTENLHRLYGSAPFALSVRQTDSHNHFRSGRESLAQ